LLEQFECRLSIGLSVPVIETMVAAGHDVCRLLARCSFVAAPPDAARLLADLGVEALTMCILGPTIAMECPARTGLHVGTGPWQVESRHGEIVVSGLHPSAPEPFVRTGWAGDIDAGSCPCGSDDPRVILV
jgi:hypothetical protein